MKNHVVLLFAMGLTRVLSFAIVPNRRPNPSNLQASKESTTTLTARDSLLHLLESIPQNTATSEYQTNRILEAIQDLERQCPTESHNVLQALTGTWELVWTAQDPSQPESRRLFQSWINPLENQSYSNRPLGSSSKSSSSSSTGQSNPFLPLPIQERLEKAGYVTSTNLRSTQTIDPVAREVRNVVGLQLGKRRASLTVTVDFQPDASDARRVNVKFQACRVACTQTGIDFTIPLGIMGPTGWLRTVYIDETMRVTRGHKGSVFVLFRPGSKSTFV